MTTIRPKVFRYHTRVRWEREKRGTLTSPGKPDLQWAAPPEFRGHEGIWTPEDYFVAAVNTCYLSTFISFAERAHLRWLAYECEAEGILTTVEGKMMFTEVTLSPRITLADMADREKALQVTAQSEEHCLVANSLKTRVQVKPEIVGK